MTHTRKSPPKTHLAALAAFGLASLGSIATLAAHPAHDTPVPQPRPVPSHYDGHDRPDYDLDGDGILEHVEVDYRHYDRNRDGVLGPAERTAYWMHMMDMGKFGSDLSGADRTRLARMANYFDVDGDGRLTERERVAVSRLISARKAFNQIDRNRDNTVTRREARSFPYRRPYDDGRYYIQGGAGSSRGLFGWFGHGSDFRRPDPVRSNNWIAQRFEILDRNDNGSVSWNEVESHLILAFRRGTRP
jgi:Ca2+-binding EF-hand superfamily protein